MQLLVPLSTLDFRPLHATGIAIENQGHSTSLSTPLLLRNKRACPLGQASRAFKDSIGFEGTKALPNNFRGAA